jgi:hypothetical protein
VNALGIFACADLSGAVQKLQLNQFVDLTCQPPRRGGEDAVNIRSCRNCDFLIQPTNGVLKGELFMARSGAQPTFVGTEKIPASTSMPVAFDRGIIPNGCRAWIMRITSSGIRRSGGYPSGPRGHRRTPRRRGAPRGRVTRFCRICPLWERTAGRRLPVDKMRSWTRFGAAFRLPARACHDGGRASIFGATFRGSCIVFDRDGDQANDHTAFIFGWSAGVSCQFGARKAERDN